MKTRVFLVVCLLAGAPSAFAGKSVSVRSYTRSDGTHVSAHTRSSGGGGGGSFAAPAFSAPMPAARVQPRQAARTTARGMAGAQIVHVEGYFRKDGTWVPPHTREWDGIKNRPAAKRTRTASAAGKPGRNAHGAAPDDDDVGPGDHGGPAVVADGDWNDEDFDHMVDDDGKPVERPGVRMAGRIAVRGGNVGAVPEHKTREWRDRDGKVIAVGWVGSRLDEIFWVRTDKGESVRVEVDDLCLDDQDFLEQVTR